MRMANPHDPAGHFIKTYGMIEKISILSNLTIFNDCLDKGMAPYIKDGCNVVF